MNKTYREVKESKIEYLEYEASKLEVELDRINSRLRALHNEPDGEKLYPSYKDCDRCGTSEAIGCFCYGAD